MSAAPTYGGADRTGGNSLTQCVTEPDALRRGWNTVRHGTQYKFGVGAGVRPSVFAAFRTWDRAPCNILKKQCVAAQLRERRPDPNGSSSQGMFRDAFAVNPVGFNEYSQIAELRSLKTDRWGQQLEAFYPGRFTTAVDQLLIVLEAEWSESRRLAR